MNEETHNNDKTEKMFNRQYPSCVHIDTRILLLPDNEKTNIRSYSHYKIYRRESGSIQKLKSEKLIVKKKRPFFLLI
jgi:hypothetical protein